MSWFQVLLPPALALVVLLLGGEGVHRQRPSPGRRPRAGRAGGDGDPGAADPAQQAVGRHTAGGDEGHGAPLPQGGGQPGHDGRLQGSLGQRIQAPHRGHHALRGP